jgi:hypothetical protein
MPVSRELKRRILQSRFCYDLRMKVEVNCSAFEQLRGDVRRLAIETLADRELDKEALQAI